MILSEKREKYENQKSTKCMSYFGMYSGNRTYRVWENRWNTKETPKKHEAITFMAPYLEVDNFIEEVHKTYPEIEAEAAMLSKKESKLCKVERVQEQNIVKVDEELAGAKDNSKAELNN